MVMIMIGLLILWDGCVNFLKVFIIFSVFLLKKSIIVMIVLKKYFVWFLLNWCKLFWFLLVCLLLNSSKIWLL